MKRKWVGTLAVLILLTACGAGGLRAPDGSPYAPYGPNAENSVDGLIVGHRLMAAGEYELALRSYSRAIGDQGVTPDILSALGSANLRLGRLNQAEKLLRQAIEDEPGFVPAWNNLGVILIERGNIVEAEQIFRRAFALDSGESDDIRDNLRLALAKLENNEYDDTNDNNFRLVRRGSSEYLILQAPRG